MTKETQAEKIKGLQVEMKNVSTLVREGFSETKSLIRDVNEKVEKLSNLRYEIDTLKIEVEDLKKTAQVLAVKTNRNAKVFPTIAGIIGSVGGAIITFLLIEYLRSN